MTAYLYTVWFRDIALAPDDQDYEWPACFLVEAHSEKEAATWGNHLSRSYSRRHPTEVFLRSTIGLHRELSAHWALPRIEAGFEASDEVIGW